MFTVLLLLSALNSSRSIAIPTLDDVTNHSPIMLLGREVPECLNIARFRTLQEIIWSCLVTIFACTWLAVHPNVPGPNDCGWTRLKRKATTFMYAVLAPELITMWALRQWFEARLIVKTVNRKDDNAITGVDSEVETTTGIGAGEEIENKGDSDSEALVVAEANVEKKPGLGKTPLSHSAALKNAIKEWFHDGPRQSQSKEWTITHGFLLQMGGFMLCNGEKPLRVLEDWELITLVNKGKVDLPRLSEDEINDKSKGDFLTKLFVVLQTTWFIVQCLARWITHLPVTELEVVTLAFAALNIVTYGLWWNKPQNILVAISVPLKLGDERELQQMEDEEEGWLKRKLKEARDNGWFMWFMLVQWRLFLAFLRPFGKLMGVTDLSHHSLRVSMFRVNGLSRSIDAFGSDQHTDGGKPDLPILVVGFLFGALHLIPWSSSFPSTAERWLWRSSAIIITTEPLLFFLLGRVYNTDWDIKNGITKFLSYFIYLVTLLGIPLYLLSRFTLLILAFTTLCALPRGTYANIQWTTFVPHI